MPKYRTGTALTFTNLLHFHKDSFDLASINVCIKKGEKSTTDGTYLGYCVHTFVCIKFHIDVNEQDAWCQGKYLNEKNKHAQQRDEYFTFERSSAIEWTNAKPFEIETIWRRIVHFSQTEILKMILLSLVDSDAWQERPIFIAFWNAFQFASD